MFHNASWSLILIETTMSLTLVANTSDLKTTIVDLFYLYLNQENISN